MQSKNQFQEIREEIERNDEYPAQETYIQHYNRMMREEAARQDALRQIAEIVEELGDVGEDD